MTNRTVVSTHRSQAKAGPDLEVDQTTLAGWLELIRSEYLEVPGLHLTKQQAQRLWSLDGVTCDALLGALLDVRFLRLTSDGGYVRADNGSR